MLLGQNRRGRHEGHLLSAQNRLKGRAHRDFGLAVADVSAKKAVHGHGLFHVLLNFLGHVNLVGSVLVRKGRLKGRLPFRVLGECVAGRGLSARIQVNQLLRQLFHGLLDAVLAVFPSLASDSVKPWLFALVSDVALDKVGLLDWNKGHVLVRVFQLYVVPLVAGALHALDSLEKADSVVYVNHIVAGRKLHKSVYGNAFRAANGLRRLFAAAKNFILLNRQKLDVGN